mmetsp:Transcript_21982/g.61789  ORF Transcript_21982/g.61789 Transcript_21982/m.61789 type:complete len:265 (-) Transcript_21982:2031-2825(-)
MSSSTLRMRPRHRFSSASFSSRYVICSSKFLSASSPATFLRSKTFSLAPTLLCFRQTDKSCRCSSRFFFSESSIPPLLELSWISCRSRCSCACSCLISRSRCLRRAISLAASCFDRSSCRSRRSRRSSASRSKRSFSESSPSASDRASSSALFFPCSISNRSCSSLIFFSSSETVSSAWFARFSFALARFRASSRSRSRWFRRSLSSATLRSASAISLSRLARRPSSSARVKPLAEDKSLPPATARPAPSAPSPPAAPAAAAPA